MADTTELARPLIVVGGKIQAFSARCLEHSATVSAMLVVNDVEFRQLMDESPALVAVLDRSMEFTDEMLRFLESITADLDGITTIVIDDDRKRRRLEATLRDIHSNVRRMANHQETDGS